eukprot:TRINITY_DN2687_c0_g1_i1.p1 TRINITY_DN2687_c0_g1~~TRINITY_DN2687_c0_g1_i1.p1  ORF type:complete len:732 (-),score=215.20 TRINITY_DN2687_c0_g1_i1:240-2435(-)
MIIRTPPKRRKTTEERVLPIALPERSPESNRETSLVVFEGNVSRNDDIHDESLVCTYQCRQLVKSEVLESLDKREKEVLELQSKVKVLEELNENKERQNKQFESRILIMEQELAAANGREKAIEERYTKDVKQFQEWLESHIKRCTDAEMNFQHEKKLRVEAELKANAASEKSEMLDKELQKLIETSDRERQRLHQELLKLKEDNRITIARLTAERDTAICKANSAVEEADLLRKQYKGVEDKLSETERKNNDLEQKLSKALGELQCSSSHEGDILVKHLQEELKHYEKEVAEARNIKKFHANSELLREKVLEEKHRADRAEAALESLPTFQSKVADLESELESWKSMMEDIPGAKSCDDVPRKIADLQKEAMAGVAKVAELSMQLTKLQDELYKAENRVQEAKHEACLMKEERDEALNNIKRLERKVSLLSKERDGLKSIISSYEEEELVSSKREKVDAEAAENPKNRRIQELDAALLHSENDMKLLEQDLEKQGEAVKNQRLEIESLRLGLDDAKRKIKALEREGDQLRLEVALYESKLGHGDFNPVTTKVLRMVNTFGTNDQKDTIESLHLEVQKLQSRLQVFEDLKIESEDGNILGTAIPERISELKAQIATLQKREERYKKVFAEKISVFRLACCSLFGYKIQMDEQQQPSGIPITLFTLQSIYAQNDEEKLEFVFESGNMDIKINDYTRQAEIEREIKVFIHKFQSIPAFTANLTVELFNRSTMS